MSEFVCVPQRADTDAESKVSVNSDTASVSEAEKVQNTNTNSSQVEDQTLKVQFLRAEITKFVENVRNLYLALDKENSNELLKGLLTDNFCHVCDATLLFDSQRISHYEGRKHAQRVRLYLQSKRTEGLSQNPVSNQRALSQDREKFCGLCNMVFSSAVVAKSHYEGKVHAKNLKRNNLPPSSDVLPQLSAAFPNPGLREGAVRGAGDEAMGAPEQGTQQEVDLSDPNKYCSLCTASFNNPLMAQQHYSGRKHQRNHARQQLLSQLGDDDPDRVSSLTCPVCCVTLSSVETYQAHMQGNKHHIKEKKVINLCKSQRKVYDSFQDELADYIQVQKARGLEPRTGSEGQAEREELEEEILCPAEDFQTQGAPLRPDPLLHNPPAATAVPPPSWCPPFQSPTNQFGSGGRGMGPRPHLWGQGYPVQPPPLIPGLTGRVFNRVRSPDSYSSSSFSDSSSYSSNRSSSSSSDNSKERRRWRKKRRERKRREYEGEEEEETERKGTKRKRTREGEGEYDAKRARRREHGRGVSLEEEEVVKEDEKRNNQRGRRRREVSSVDEEEEERRRRRVLGKRNKKQRERNHGDGHHGDKHDSKRKRGEAKEQRREGREITTETDMDKVAEMESEQTQDRMEGSRTERVEMKEGRGKHRKEKKRTKEKMDGDDMRTEEEKLWDETILGVF